jgi:hypothetical protein
VGEFEVAARDSVLKMVVVDGQIAILEIAYEGRPAPQAVLDSFSRCRALWDLTALSHQPLPEEFCDGLGTLLSKLPAAFGIEFLLPSLAFDLVQRAEEPQRLFGNIAEIMGIQVMELASRVCQASNFKGVEPWISDD